MTIYTNVYAGGEIHVAASDTPHETLCGVEVQTPSKLPVSCTTCMALSREAMAGRRVWGLRLVNRERKERGR